MASRKLKKIYRSVIKRLKKNFKDKNTLSFVFVLVGIFVFSFGAINYYKVRVLSFSSAPKVDKEITEWEEKDIPVEIIIPSINIDLKVEPGEIKDGVWQISHSQATFLNTSALPDTNGNTVIYAHNKKVLFGSLPYLERGGKINLKTKSGKIYDYVVDQKYFVRPDRVDLVSPKDSDLLTLYSCWGLLDSKRVVIVAKPI